MTTPPEPGGPNAAWTEYRTWAATARYHRSALDFWNQWALRLGIGGAVLAALGQQIAPWAPVDGPLALLFRTPGMVGAAIIALAAYFSTQALGGNREQVWIRSRAAAESLKSAIYLYRAGVPPFDTPTRVAEIGKRIETTLKELGDIERRPPDVGETRAALGPLTLDQYIMERVKDQIEFYRTRSQQYQASADRYRMITIGLGALSVLLGLASAASAVSAWLAVIATVTASITAYLKNQRYQYLIGIYQSTATRLQLLLDQWLDGGQTDADKTDRDLFIQRCEETMALENGAWVAQWKEQPAPGGAGQPAAPGLPPPAAGADRGVPARPGS